jgi:hypothetical protein
LLPRFHRKLFAAIPLFVGFAFVLCAREGQSATQFRDPNGVFLVGVDPVDVDELTDKLRKITGLSTLAFDRDGKLTLQTFSSDTGSALARRLLIKAISGDKHIVIDDASRRSDVVFARVINANVRVENSENRPAFIVQLDFGDFDHITGDRWALQAFDVGWVVLHELDHIISGSLDPAYYGEIGECESHINQMRRECGLPERSDYFFIALPTPGHSIFNRQFVRLGFEHQVAGIKKRYWLVWDVKLVGELIERKQLAAVR